MGRGYRHITWSSSSKTFIDKKIIIYHLFTFSIEGLLNCIVLILKFYFVLVQI